VCSAENDADTAFLMDIGGLTSEQPTATAPHASLSPSTATVHMASTGENPTGSCGSISRLQQTEVEAAKAKQLAAGQGRQIEELQVLAYI